MSEIAERIAHTGTLSGQKLVNRYVLEGLIGRGGMADVYRAHDDVLDRPVAIKVFRTPLVDLPSDTQTVSTQSRRHAEMRALAALNHPNLTALYDACEDSDPAFLVLELIDGPSLATELASGPLPEPNVRSIGIQVADALAYVHARQMVHRDVKPANVLLGPDATSADAPWRVRLSDFGIVRLLGTERLTQVDFTVGSASYLAPEQARGGDVGPAADIYSFGLVLLEALTGRCPFEGTTPETLAARLTRPPDIPPALPNPWPQLLTAMTALDPAARPTAREVSVALRNPQRAAVPVFAATTQLPLAAAAAGAATNGFVAGPGAGLEAGPEVGPEAGPEDDYEPGRHHTGLIAVALLALAVAGLIAIMHSHLPGLPHPAQTEVGNGTSSAAQLARPATSGAQHTTPASTIRQQVGGPARSAPAKASTQPALARTSAAAHVAPPPATQPAPTTAAVAPTPTQTPTPTPSPTGSATSTSNPLPNTSPSGGPTTP